MRSTKTGLDIKNIIFQMQLSTLDATFFERFSLDELDKIGREAHGVLLGVNFSETLFENIGVCNTVKDLKPKDKPTPSGASSNPKNNMSMLYTLTQASLISSLSFQGDKNIALSALKRLYEAAVQNPGAPSPSDSEMNNHEVFLKCCNNLGKKLASNQQGAAQQPKEPPLEKFKKLVEQLKSELDNKKKLHPQEPLIDMIKKILDEHCEEILTKGTLPPAVTALLDRFSSDLKDYIDDIKQSDGKTLSDTLLTGMIDFISMLMYIKPLDEAFFKLFTINVLEVILEKTNQFIRTLDPTDAQFEVIFNNSFRCADVKNSLKPEDKATPPTEEKTTPPAEEKTRQWTVTQAENALQSIDKQTVQEKDKTRLQILNKQRLIINEGKLKLELRGIESQINILLETIKEKRGDTCTREREALYQCRRDSGEIQNMLRAIYKKLGTHNEIEVTAIPSTIFYNKPEAVTAVHTNQNTATPPSHPVPGMSSGKTS